MKKVAIYVRVSTEDQNTDMQKEACVKYSEAHNYEIFKIYSDITSGTKSSRPSLNQMMFDMRNGLFDGIIIWKLDRLGRSLSHLLNLVEEFQKRHIDFVCITQNFDTSTSQGKLVFTLIGAIAEFERELISERTKEGMKKAKNVGKRGKDKKPRNKSGYHLRWIKQNSSKKVREKYIPPSF